MIPQVPYSVWAIQWRSNRYETKLIRVWWGLGEAAEQQMGDLGI